MECDIRNIDCTWQPYTCSPPKGHLRVHVAAIHEQSEGHLRVHVAAIHVQSEGHLSYY